MPSGVKMPLLGYGVYQVDRRCERCVTDAIAVGYRSIDTAQAYHNEEGVGNAVRKSGLPREDFFLTTKVWISNGGYEKAKASIDESLAKLQTDYIDLLLIRNPSTTTTAPGGPWRRPTRPASSGPSACPTSTRPAHRPVPVF